jgi:hypothetical protein
VFKNVLNLSERRESFAPSNHNVHDKTRFRSVSSHYICVLNIAFSYKVIPILRNRDDCFAQFSIAE